MRHFLVALVLGGMSTTLAAAPADTVPYRNWFLTVQIPSEAENIGPGLYEIVHDAQPGQIEVGATTPLIRDYHTESMYCLDNIPTERLVKPDLYSFTCNKGPRTIYHVAKFGQNRHTKTGDVIDTLELTVYYPTEQRAYWQPIATKLADSLQFNELEPKK